MCEAIPHQVGYNWQQCCSPRSALEYLFGEHLHCKSFQGGLRMMERMIRCANCGTQSAVALPANVAHAGFDTPACPVCHLPLTVEQHPALPITSMSDLEAQLDALVSSALASGLDSAGVIEVLRSEIAFAAEMGQTGHRFAVQLIDLGLEDRDYMPRTQLDRNVLLQQRNGHQ
jgi:hypothetical protein